MGKCPDVVGHHGDTGLPQGGAHEVGAVVHVVVAEHGEASQGRAKVSKDRRYGLGAYAAAAEGHHVHEVAAEADEMRTQCACLVDESRQPDDVTAMAADMEV
jgi:hypothetical protein